MRAPHPLLRKLYRQPAALLARERQEMRLIERLEVDLDAAGMSGETLLAPLLATVSLADPLDRALRRVDQAGAPAEQSFARSPSPFVPTREAEGRQGHRAAAIGADRVDPLPQGRTAGADRGRAAGANRRRKTVPPELGEPSAAPADAVPRLPAAAPTTRQAILVTEAASRQPAPATATAEGASRWLADLAQRAGAGEALHRPIAILLVEDSAGSRAATSGTAAPRDAGTRLPPAIAADAPHERLLLARTAPLARACAAPGAGLDADRNATSGVASVDRDSAEISGRRDPPMQPPGRRNRVAPPAALDQVRSALPGRARGLTGLRGLAALGRAIDNAARAGPPAPEAGRRDPPGRPAIDADDLADLLRREAERSGIDLTGLEP